jgi:light-regulated signal transduction histidine kinase (bacteriophytochrome)
LNDADGARPEHEAFVNLVHGLRQPLSTIETCAYLLRSILSGVEDERISENLECIERQVAEAHRILLEAAQAPVASLRTKAASAGQA